MNGREVIVGVSGEVSEKDERQARERASVTPSSMPALYAWLELDYMHALPYRKDGADFQQLAHRVYFRAIQWANEWLSEDGYCLNFIDWK